MSLLKRLRRRAPADAPFPASQTAPAPAPLPAPARAPDDTVPERPFRLVETVPVLLVRAGKPLGSGLLDPGTVWFSAVCALLLLVPLSLNAGPRAGAAYLVAVLIGLVGNRVLRGSALSFVPWALQFGLYPAYLAYGGWSGAGTDTPPTEVMVVLAGLLGIGVRFLRSLPGLVTDSTDGRRSLPLRIALRTGAPRLLVLSKLFTGAIVVAQLIAGQAIGLT